MSESYEIGEESRYEQGSPVEAEASIAGAPITWVDPLTKTGVPDGFARLWTPHRVAYIKGESHPEDQNDQTQCPFCVVPGYGDDAKALIVRRSKLAFVVLNIFPYNSGHILVCPYRHISLFTELTKEEREEVGELTAQAMRVLRAVSGVQGFNIGINQGDVAGAGIAGHFHQHIVPRFGGDANFFPIIGQTKALPYLLGQTRDLLAETWDKYALDDTYSGPFPARH